MKIPVKIRKFYSKIRGNVAITFAIALLPVMLSIGAMIDYSEGTQLRAKMAHATDAAILSSVAGIRVNTDLDNKSDVLAALRKDFEPFFLANMPESILYKYQGYKIAYNAEDREIDVDVHYIIKTFVLGIVGKDTLDVKVAAGTRIHMSSGGAISIFLVLDKSGSMALENKITTLKVAVRDMTSHFESIDPRHKYVRMGAISFDSQAQKKHRISWGTGSTNNYVQALRAFGGTNSSQAVKKAFQALRHPREIRLHQAMSHQKPAKIMVFMTDGSNNKPQSDKQTIKTCKKAKQADIEIYTVAFKAPLSGQQLLKSCATDTSHYFSATNSQDLIDAFHRIGEAVSEKLVLYK